MALEELAGPGAPPNEKLPPSAQLPAPGVSGSIVTVLLQATKTTLAALTAIGAEFDLTPDEWLILDALTHHDELSMAGLSQQGLASGATLTRAVDRLASKALVYREASATDRRKIHVHLSVRGVALHEQMRPQVLQMEEEVERMLQHSGLPALAELDLRAGRNS